MPIKRYSEPSLPLTVATDQERSSKAQRQEVFLPVSGFVWLYPEEIAIVDHPAFQRLSKINQLGQANLVFRGATHKRFEHVLGVVHIAQRMIAAVNFNMEKAEAKGRKGLSARLTDDEQRFIRLGALLHDIGHIAAGHTLEDELELIGKHDADKRLKLILSKDDWDAADDVTVQPLGELIDERYKKYLPPKLGKKLSASQIVRLLIRKPASPDRDQELQHIIETSDEVRYHVCSNMIGNTICADLLDYLHRDWYHVGKPRNIEDRIFQYMEIRRSGTSNTKPVAHHDDRFVIVLGEDTKIRTDGVTAILGLLEWRYELAESVLFHRTKLAAGAMLDRALYELWDNAKEDDLVDKVLHVSDEELLSHAIQEASNRLKQQPTEREAARMKAATRILKKLRDRRIFQELKVFSSSNLAELRINSLQKTYGTAPFGEPKAASNRVRVAREIEIDFGLPEGSIAIYCRHIRPKIAEVSISVDGQIEKFAKLDESKEALSGGHLKAQVARFERLWRLCFFIDRDVKARLAKERLSLIQNMISDVVLSSDEPEQLAERTRQIALMFVEQEKESGKNNIQYQGDIVTAAKSDPDSALSDETNYPNGAPVMRSFVRKS